MRVLIVDDNPLDRAEAKAALLNGSRRRYHFSEASTADDALRLCAERLPPDCIVLDLGLPDADEFGVLERLPRDEDQLLSVPVVVLTGSAELGLNQAALRAGAQEYVGKAWLRPETLTQAVENAIERLAMARALGVQRRLAEASRIHMLQLEGENRQIQEATRLKSQFLANMSHELRTPLTAIIGFADLLHMGAVLPAEPQYRTFLGHIGSSGRQLLRLIDDVLDLSKVESGKFEFFPESFDLAVLVKEVQDVLHTEVRRKHLRVIADIEPAIGKLMLDAARLKQVLFNYLSNAIKFTLEHGVIIVRARAAGARHVRIEVEDFGVGIAASDLPRLFTAYEQLDAGATKKYQGSGLGLALARRLVMAQGGSVGVRSTPGVGSVFHLVLNRVHGTDPVRCAEPQYAGSAIADRQLLMIHDAGDDAPQLLTGLAAAGFSVDAAPTGQQAVERARTREYDAITLSLLLPDQCGLTVLQTIRNEGLNRASPVVGMTMRAQAGSAATFAIADVWCKPIRTDQVVSAMRSSKATGASPTRVMVIDDDPMALDLMRATLLAIGIEAVCIADGREALRELDRYRPEAIILDLVMPGFDGFAVLDALRQQPVWRDTPVYVWTSMNLSDAEYLALGRSVCAILRKGGAVLDDTLDSLRTWRPSVSPSPSPVPVGSSL